MQCAKEGSECQSDGDAEGSQSEKGSDACEKRAAKIEPHVEQVRQSVGQAEKRPHSRKLHELRSQLFKWSYSVISVITLTPP